MITDHSKPGNMTCNIFPSDLEANGWQPSQKESPPLDSRLWHHGVVGVVQTFEEGSEGTLIILSPRKSLKKLLL